MLMVVTTVSLMVQIYSQGYMKDDAGYHRYYAWMSLFTTAMLGLVMANNLLLAFMFWELVGLCSYLLIGFWFHKPSAANAAKKAFIVTRIGDFGFLAAIILLYTHTGTFDIATLQGMAVSGALAGSVLTWAAIGIFAGAIGKSAQFPLHVWLPDAMEGPTPVSALIHAATMAAAGVFLVARTYPLFEHSATALTYGRNCRRFYGDFRCFDRAGTERYQTGAGLFYNQSIGVHDAGVSYRRSGRGHLPPV